MFGHQTLLDCVSSPKLQTFPVSTGLHDCTRLQTKWSGFEPLLALRHCSCAKHFPDSASLHLASSRGSVSHGAVQKTAREKIKKSAASSRRAFFFYFFTRCFLRCALTNWSPGRGYSPPRCTKDIRVSVNYMQHKGDGGRELTWKRLSFHKGVGRGAEMLQHMH